MRRTPSAAAAFAALFLSAPALAQNCASPKPIVFAPGASSGKVAGGVIRGERDCYSIAAQAGQTMTIAIAAPERNAAFQLYAPGWSAAKDRDGIWSFRGTALPGAGESNDATRWSGRLPANGRYLLVVGGTRGNAGYDVTVTIK